jgi:ribosomal protein S12 methylthiotransferase accessory factor
VPAEGTGKNAQLWLELPNGRPVWIAEDGLYGFDGAASDEEPDCVSAYWELAGAGSRPGSVEIAAIGAPAQFLEFVLGQQGIEVQGGGLRVVVTHDYLRPEVAEAVEGHGRVLLAKTVGRTLWLGPYLHGAGPCLDCLRWWLTLNRYPQNSLVLAGAGYAPDHAVARLPSTDAMAAGWVATAASLLSAGVALPALEGAILHFDTVSQQISRSAVIGRGDCRRCAGRRLRLESFESRYTGIARDIAMDSAMGFAVAIGRCILSYPGAPESAIVAPQSIGGKGATVEQARTSAIGEAIERYSLVYQGNEPVVRAAGETIPILDPVELLLDAGAQGYDPAKERLWAMTHCISGGADRYAPAEYVYFWSPEEPAGRLCVSDSNGCACASDIASAQLSGLIELIERDAVAIWWYNRLGRPALDVARVEDGALRSAIAAAAAEGWTAELLDITTEFGVPVYVAVARHRETGAVRLGTAADTDGSKAALKALAEAALVHCWAAREDRESGLNRWLRALTPERHPQIAADGLCDLRRGGWEESAEERIREIVRRLGRSGVECFCVDLTRPEIQWPAVRMIAPGLRPFARRLAPGRLYDVPVRMGWLAEARGEADMETASFAL